MKKIAILIATLLVVCLMACACGKVEENSAPASQAPTSQAPASKAPTSQAPASQAPASQAPASQAPTSQAPSNPATGSFYDFSADANAAGKGAVMTGTYGAFTVTNGKSSTSSGKTAKDGGKVGTVFTGGVQLGTNGSAADKYIAFTATGSTVDVYANYGSSSATSGNLTLATKAGVVVGTKIVAKDIYVSSWTVTSGTEYILYVGDAVSSVNVWGIQL